MPKLHLNLTGLNTHFHLTFFQMKFQNIAKNYSINIFGAKNDPDYQDDHDEDEDEDESCLLMKFVC